MTKSRGIAFGVIGALLAFFGGCFCVGGNATNNDLKTQWSSYLNTGAKDSKGDLMIFGGVSAIVIGIILIIIGIAVYFSANKEELHRAITGKFKSQSGLYTVVFNPNGTCIWTQKETNYPANFKRINDNLWTIDIVGFGKAFDMSMEGNNLRIKGGSVDEIFYS